MIIVLWKTRVKHVQRFLTSLTFCRNQLFYWRLHENRSTAQISFFFLQTLQFLFCDLNNNWCSIYILAVSGYFHGGESENHRVLARKHASEWYNLALKKLSLSSGRTVSGDSILGKISLFSCDLKENANNCFRLRTSNLFFVPISVDYKLIRAEMKTTRRR